MEKPKYVFKFKSITAENLQHSLEIIYDHKLYLSSRTELNDPMECGIGIVSLGVMGAGQYAEIGIPHPAVESLMDAYKILSLTSLYNSPQMWAHYANNYSGVCFVFSSKGALSDIRKVSYSDEKFHFNEEDLSIRGIEPIDCIRDVYFYKSRNWEYEQEWRIVRPSTETHLLFAPAELCGVIVGHNVKHSELQMKVINACSKNAIPVYQTFTSTYGYDVEIAPVGFTLNGSPEPIAKQIASAFMAQGGIPDFLADRYSV